MGSTHDTTKVPQFSARGFTLVPFALRLIKADVDLLGSIIEEEPTVRNKSEAVRWCLVKERGRRAAPDTADQDAMCASCAEENGVEHRAGCPICGKDFE